MGEVYVVWRGDVVGMFERGLGILMVVYCGGGGVEIRWVILGVWIGGGGGRVGGGLKGFCGKKGCFGVEYVGLNVVGFDWDC